MTMCMDLWKTVCSEINVSFLLMFCLGYYLALSKILRLVVLTKDKQKKKTRANSNLKADQSNFLAN